MGTDTEEKQELYSEVLAEADLLVCEAAERMRPDRGGRAGYGDRSFGV